MATSKTKSKTQAPAKKSAASARKASPARRTQVAKSKAQPPRLPKFPERKPTAEEIAHKQALERFSAGLEMMNAGQFSKARAAFERLVDHPSREIGERSKVYVNICTQRLSKQALQPRSVDELYDYAVSLANEGHHDQAEEHLRRALKLSPNSDFLYYALAATFALRNDVEGTLEYLDKAIQLNHRNRYQAQNDPDFENMLEDPRFTELIYPERPLG